MGFDSREKLTYDVARHSILSRTSKPEETIVIPIELAHMRARGLLTRPIEMKDGKMWCPISQAPMATEFAISRFCVRGLAQRGLALFVDSDIVCLDDITKLFALADPKYAVMVVKHNHKPIETTKMDGQIQTTYHRKNWSSVVLWNLDHPGHKDLTWDALNNWPGRDLHAFKWLKDEEIGELTVRWNYLAGVDKTIPESEVDDKVGIVHFTLGGPWLPDWSGGPLDRIWRKEKEQAFK